MWNGKLKAVTFSFDDNVTQDIRAIDIMNRYGLKGTFNLNSGFMGQPGSLIRQGVSVSHNKNAAADIPKIYVGHEVAAHTITHPLLPTLSDEDVIREVEQDRIALSEICGYEVVGMAYPGGGQNHDDRVVELVRRYTGIKYARTIISSYKFDDQPDLIRFNPTIHHQEANVNEICERFFAQSADKPQLLYIWGHAYEMDISSDGWERFEKLCQLVSGKGDVFYGTNREVLLGY